MPEIPQIMRPRATREVADRLARQLPSMPAMLKRDVLVLQAWTVFLCAGKVLFIHLPGLRRHRSHPEAPFISCRPRTINGKISRPAQSTKYDKDVISPLSGFGDTIA